MDWGVLSLSQGEDARSLAVALSAAGEDESEMMSACSESETVSAEGSMSLPEALCLLDRRVGAFILGAKRSQGNRTVLHQGK